MYVHMLPSLHLQWHRGGHLPTSRTCRQKNPSKINYLQTGLTLAWQDLDLSAVARFVPAILASLLHVEILARTLHVEILASLLHGVDLALILQSRRSGPALAW